MAKQFASENLPPEIQAIAETMNVVKENTPPCCVPELPFGEDCTPDEFLNKVRKELRKPFEDYIFGSIPPRCEELLFRTTSEGMAFDGLAIRREIDIVCRHNGVERIFHMLLYIPSTATEQKKVPVFFGLNFKGNHACTPDPGVTFHAIKRYPPLIPGSLRWADNRASEEERGIQAGRWEFEKVLKAGFASATICYYDIFPDHFHGCFEDGIMPMFYTKEQWESPQRNTGGICAWVWGIMRGIDCLETQKELDMTCLTVHGHSRLGKTSLLAGAYDPRIALTVSNGSGACGVKMMHHYYGENFAWLNYWNPHWFRGNYGDIVNRDCEFDFDFHYLAAAVAPRLLYVSDGDADVYADAEGEFLTCVEASKAWKIFGMEGMGNETFPPCGKLVGREVGFYLRQGEHDFTPENWDALLEFASRHFIK